MQSPTPIQDDNPPDAARATEIILDDFGPALHRKRKLRISRSHRKQTATGLVVSPPANLPRATRRRLRAIRHRLAATDQCTLTEARLAGWTALEHMIVQQRPPVGRLPANS